MRDLLFSAVFMGLIPLSFFRPWMGILAWCWVSFMNPHRLTWMMADKPVAMAIGLATLAGLLLSTKDVRSLPAHPLVLIMMALWLWVAVTTMQALEPALAWTELTEFSKVMFMVLVSMLLMQERRRLRLLLLVVAGSIGFYGIKGGLFSVLTGGVYRVWGPPGSAFEDNNDLALALNMVLPLLVFFARSDSNVWVRRVAGASAFLTILAVVFTYSRGGFIGLVAVLGIMVVRSRHRMPALALVAIFAVAALIIAPPHWVERVESIRSYEQDASVQGRFNAWFFAWNLALDRPVVGGGFGAFTDDWFSVYAPVPDDVHAAHSIYFDALGGHGFVGLGIFLALLGAGIVRAESLRKKLLRRGASWFAGCAEALQISFIGYAVCGTFLGTTWFDLYYQLIAALVLVDLLARPILELSTQEPTIAWSKEAAPCAA